MKRQKHYLGNLDWHGNLGWHGNVHLHDVLDWHGLLGWLCCKVDSLIERQNIT